PVVEHFIPHKENKELKYDWKNLYYSCHRCNSIKGVEKDILDCCDDSVDVSKSVKCLCSSVPDDDIKVEAQNADQKTQNTANLLHRCYNENNTGIRSISRECLHDSIFEMYCDFITHRRILKNRDALQSEKADALEHLKNMVEDSYPFSIFWKWHIKSEPSLTKKFPDLLEATGI
ncbi:MAG: HNH endonuclease, partial [Spirochaetaceae bacterium]|nr:HNH endonuclease [Spirochaetaceae bacterium]